MPERYKVRLHRLNYDVGYEMQLYGIVSNKIDSCVEGINEGDIIDVPGFDMEDKEIINQIYNKLIFINSGKEIEFILNGKKVRCKPIKMFS
jgi:hypothetical protein